ncbi:hypothetical protein OIU76_010575 [Salix suchowensis]|nr:hypothetical protein OIU76_010575 [Salix suchowensis]
MRGPQKIDNLTFVQCHEHGSSHGYYSSNHLCLASDFLYVHDFHPAKNCHDKRHCRQHVAHGTGKGRRSEFQPGIVKVLINHRPHENGKCNLRPYFQL